MHYFLPQTFKTIHGQAVLRAERIAEVRAYFMAGDTVQTQPVPHRGCRLPSSGRGGVEIAGRMAYSVNLTPAHKRKDIR